MTFYFNLFGDSGANPNNHIGFVVGIDKLLAILPLLVQYKVSLCVCSVGDVRVVQRDGMVNFTARLAR